ncbi:vitelline membrane outer layer protein 1 homolog [Penaeus japonicus]|uniref:vitelline membrane outer layer protein 1 homolog n=1 Tax=Penaeus japonicus TaxID=27405 RepID=UPI001C715544|nr:vitelline membrane outer layer protein 1 homolog [Penaeus japonicus]
MLPSTPRLTSLLLAVALCRAANISDHGSGDANLPRGAPREASVGSVIAGPRVLLEGEKLYLPCVASGEYTSCGWNDPHDEIFYPSELPPEGEVTPLPGFNCGIIVQAVSVERHSGHWVCVATSDFGFDSASAEVTVRPTSSWPGVVANVSSPLSGRWGRWGSVDMCPPNSFADAFEIKSEAATTGDNTAVNGLTMACRQQGGDLPARITSDGLDFGTWRGEKACPVPEYIKKFSLRVEPDQGDLGDDTAVDDVKVICTNYPEDEMVGGGENWGAWGPWAECPPDTAVCGLQTRLEPYMGVMDDDTALNDIRVFCCPLVW